MGNSVFFNVHVPCPIEEHDQLLEGMELIEK